MPVKENPTAKSRRVSRNSLVRASEKPNSRIRRALQLPPIIALHLYPDRFTADEIQAGIGSFFVHAPFHIAEAAALAGQYAPSSSEYEADQPNSNDRNA